MHCFYGLPGHFFIENWVILDSTNTTAVSHKIMNAEKGLKGNETVIKNLVTLNHWGLYRKKITPKLHQMSLDKVPLSFIIKDQTVQYDSISCRKVTYYSLWHVFVKFWAWYLHENSEIFLHRFHVMKVSRSKARF